MQGDAGPRRAPGEDAQAQTAAIFWITSSSSTWLVNPIVKASIACRCCLPRAPSYRVASARATVAYRQRRPLSSGMPMRTFASQGRSLDAHAV